MNSLVAITRHTFLEVIRHPAHGVVVIATLIILALSPRFAMFSLRGEGSLLADFGTSTLLVSGWILTCLGSSSVVRREIESRTTLTLLSKPVSREVFLTGKFLGVAAAVALSTFVFSLALLLAVRHGPLTSRADPTDWPAVVGGVGAVLAALAGAGLKRLRGASFSATFTVLAALALSCGVLFAAFFDEGWSLQAFGAGFDALLLGAALCCFLALAVLAAFAVSVSVWIGRGGTFALTALLFLAGLSVDSFPEAWTLSLVVIPDFQHFWLGDLFYLAERRLSIGYLFLSFAYAGVYVVAFLSVGALALGRKSL